MDRPSVFTHPFVHHVTKARAAERPNAIAIADARGRLRYDEMNRMTNRVAHRLRAAGAGADTRVGVLMPRGRELVVAALGVLKAGACYAPLDPNHPPERLRFMRADSRVHLHLLLRLAALATACGLAADDQIIDTVAALVDTSMPATNPGQAIHPESLSYVFYTVLARGTRRQLLRGGRPLPVGKTRGRSARRALRQRPSCPFALRCAHARDAGRVRAHAAEPAGHCYARGRRCGGPSHAARDGDDVRGRDRVAARSARRPGLCSCDEQRKEQR